MRKITEEEAEKIPSKRVGKQSMARIILENMKVGEIIILEKSEWHQKGHSPIDLIRRMRNEDKVDFILETILDGSGWIVKKIK